jgi:hypothetical protein
MPAALSGLLLALTLAGEAWAACAPLRVGIVDQHRPPYFIGRGAVEAARPGATVELLREAGASAGCKVVSVRLPALRLRHALETGTIDAMLMEAGTEDAQAFALPLDAGGHADTARGLPMFTMAFVRAADKAAADADPALFFATRTLGVNNGATLAVKLRKEGLRVDDGAADSARNLEKLARGRIDGYAAIMVAPTDADANVAALYGEQLQRMERPLRTQHFWLVFTRSYQHSNRAQVDAMWDWLGTRGHARFVALVGQYNKPR